MNKPTFQHRHYVEIAAIIARLPNVLSKDRERMAEHFAAALSGSNPNYDRERFLAAAMGKPSGRDRC